VTKSREAGIEDRRRKTAQREDGAQRQTAQREDVAQQQTAPRQYPLIGCQKKKLTSVFNGCKFVFIIHIGVNLMIYTGMSENPSKRE
jgi:hypothetical protein